MQRTVLIVEDEPAFIQLLANSVVAAGHNVLRATDGKSGLDLALTHHPDLILLDILMPGSDGITVLKKLRQDAWGAKVPVMVLSNLSDYPHVFESLAGGVQDYFVKADWTLENLVNRINARLKP